MKQRLTEKTWQLTLMSKFHPLKQMAVIFQNFISNAIKYTLNMAK
jgi:hypothetical protein